MLEYYNEYARRRFEASPILSKIIRNLLKYSKYSKYSFEFYLCSTRTKIVDRKSVEQR